ncbi:glycosyltransferase family 39 protein [Patescibacteria group bacterium]|nr:glycosyltransferase family 39 protein [Patescibacteria group bacterium]
MNYIRKNFFKIIPFIPITITYFLLRLSYLSRLPIFTDEAIYARWAQIARDDASWRFISLTDGKQPLFVWFSMIFMKFIEDPLIAARLVSVFSGFFTLIGLWFLAFELFKNKKIAYLTSILYIFYPFAQVYDRMAMMDSMVGAFSVWAIYFSILLVRKIRLDIAYTLGFIIGAGILTKTSNFFSIYLLPFTVILFDIKQNARFEKFVKWGLLALVSVAISLVIYNLLRLSPLFQMISTKNAVFVYPFSEWFNHPFTFFVGNIRGLFNWLFAYLTPFYSFLILISLVLFYKQTKEKVLLLIYFSLPFVALALFGRIIFPRFIYFMSLYLLPLAGVGLFELSQYLSNKFKISTSLSLVLLTAFFVFYPASISYTFAKDPINAKIAGSDSNQYINNWSAGWGIKESTDFLSEKASKGKIYVGTEGTFGLLPAGLELYLVRNKNITLKGYWPVEHSLPKESLDYAEKIPSYFIFYQPNNVVIPQNYPLKLIFKERAGSSDYYFRLYEIIPSKSN